MERVRLVGAVGAYGAALALAMVLGVCDARDYWSQWARMPEVRAHLSRHTIARVQRMARVLADEGLVWVLEDWEAARAICDGPGAEARLRRARTIAAVLVPEPFAVVDA